MSDPATAVAGVASDGRSRAAGRRWTRRLALMLCAALAGMVVSLGAGTAQPASADDCKPSTVPDQAGSGFPGLIDSKAKTQHPSTLYGKYGWSGLQWTTCDLPHHHFHIPKAEAASQTLDNTIANYAFGFATGLGALITQLHQWAVHPGLILKPIDDIIGKVTLAVKKSTWTPWVAATIVLAAVGVILNAFRGEIRSALKTTAAVLLACLAVAWITTPVHKGTEPGGPSAQAAEKSGAQHAASTFDGVASKIVGKVDKATTKVTDKSGSDAEARGATLNDKLLYKIWARGEFGSQKAADKYGKDVYKLGTVSWKKVNDKDYKIDSDDKQDAYNDKAQKIKDDDKSVYNHMRGTQGSRAGYSALALFVMFCIGLIRIPAEALMIAGLLVMRVLVMFGPVLALTGIVPATRPIARSAVKIGLASVVNVAILGVIASIHTVAVSAIVEHAANLAIAAVGIAVITLVIFLVSKPFRSVTRLATGEQAGEAMEGAGDAPGNALGKVGEVAIGTKLGRDMSPSDDGDQASRPSEPGRENPMPPPAPASSGGGQSPATGEPGPARTALPAPPPEPAPGGALPGPRQQPASAAIGQPGQPPPLTGDRMEPQPSLGPTPQPQPALEHTSRPAAGEPAELPQPDTPPEAAGTRRLPTPGQPEPHQPESPEAAPPAPPQSTTAEESPPEPPPAGPTRPPIGDPPQQPATAPPAPPPETAGRSQPGESEQPGAVPPPGPPLPNQPDADAFAGDDSIYRPASTVVNQSGQTVTVNDRMVRNWTVEDRVAAGGGGMPDISTLPPQRPEPELDENGHLTTSVYRPPASGDEELVGAPA